MDKMFFLYGLFKEAALPDESDYKDKRDKNRTEDIAKSHGPEARRKNNDQQLTQGQGLTAQRYRELQRNLDQAAEYEKQDNARDDYAQHDDALQLQNNRRLSKPVWDSPDDTLINKEINPFWSGLKGALGGLGVGGLAGGALTLATGGGAAIPLIGAGLGGYLGGTGFYGSAKKDNTEAKKLRDTFNESYARVDPGEYSSLSHMLYNPFRDSYSGFAPTEKGRYDGHVWDAASERDEDKDTAQNALEDQLWFQGGNLTANGWFPQMSGKERAESDPGATAQPGSGKLSDRPPTQALIDNPDALAAALGMMDQLDLPREFWNGSMDTLPMNDPKWRAEYNKR